ncbi:MAG: lipoyl(octanoyl) transferase LipB [Verrucomicrobia bacterium]|nr:lipoyl(octanoyl) transferase LipB [Verrucomicrobiota bacterium]MCH8512779.1 lipoyl(octanoyl) transferase LipB [Kiritimatiellia bacterium]
MTSARICRFAQPMPYAEAVALQERLVRARIADDIPDTLLLLQHPPTITLGRRGRREHLLTPPEQLKAHGIALETSARGGDVTYHAPGQWVLYPILKLGPREMGAHGYLHALENIAIGTAKTFGVNAFRRDGMAGAWCPKGKFAAIGFKFTRWVTWHGLSLNVNPDLAGFDLIVGCGLVGEPVTSLKAVLHENAPTMDATGDEIIRQAETVLARTLTAVSPNEL